MAIDRGNVGGYCLLTFLWSWVCWAPILFVLRSRGITDMLEAPAWALVAALFGGWGPSLMAILLTARAKGRDGVRELLSGLKRWRAPVTVHLVVWLGPSLFLGLAFLMAPGRAAELGLPVWSRLQLLPLAFVAALPFGPLGEEIGWRGFALPRLQERYGALASSLLIGVAWTFWHTPLFWAPAGTTISGGPITVWAIGKYMLTLMGMSVIFTWIFNSSRGSIALAVVFHATFNAVFPFLLFPDRSREAALFLEELSMVVVWALALILVGLYGGRRLAPEPAIEGG